jgi:hypothetical protein
MEFVRAIEKPVRYDKCLGERNIADNYKAVVNAETNELFAIMTKQYRIVQHEDVLTHIESTLKKNPEYGEWERNILFSKNGQARMHAIYRFPGVEVAVKQGDFVNPTVEVFNSYDGGWNYQVLFGAFRLVCSNGLTIGEKILHYNRRHTQNFTFLMAEEILKNGMHTFSIQRGIWEKWVDEMIEKRQMEEIFHKLELSKKDTQAVNEEIETETGISIGYTEQINMWLFYNILCQYITHSVSSELKKVRLQNQMRKLF